MESNLRHYQLACSHHIISKISDGNKRILIEMPTGSGKLRTITHTINKLTECKSILFISDRIMINEQFESFASKELINKKVVTSTVHSLLDKINYHEIDMIILDLDLRIPNKEIYQLIKKYTKTIIALSSSINNNLISLFGEPIFSMKVADLADYVIKINNLKSESISKFPFSEQPRFESIRRNMDEAMILSKIVLCQTFCDKNNHKLLQSNDLILEVVPFIIGLAISGPTAAFISKIFVMFVINYIKSKLPILLRCEACLKVNV
ncbi:DEAD/DEAH box helicase family protein [Priestia megaterium]|uniref:DEAD/DEAH box helicase family protein n=1 Tax=Priestia megaterium TaxID=1404 RepID=UPI0015D4E670|nr:DEAD/DEAH box helicase family protein [Priestia megaterium]